MRSYLRGFQFLGLPFVALLFSAPSPAAEPRTVPFVDVNHYLGTWYQIAHIPLIFEGTGPCACARQRLTPGTKPGVVEVFNSCNAGDYRGALKTIQGEATDDDLKSNAKFTVDFHLGFKGTYWIIGLDRDYRYAVVSDQSEYSLYILSKTPTLSSGLYQQALALAARQMDTSKLEVTDQNSCEYPN